MSDLTAQLEALIQTGSEDDVKKFVIEHFKEFPEETQKELAVQMLSDALDSAVESGEKLSALRKDAAEIVDDIEKSGA